MGDLAKPCGAHGISRSGVPRTQRLRLIERCPRGPGTLRQPGSV
ncbi:hypothetical protein Rhow_002936 [Rhodococcus wratislaviensis]|uniref:Uncharacterized protein n=1 Tax=Rhodococcus wratislaviensis TaxID=44752 RepID=A0A402C739_RHOWR|nr:hypothetical protein Rhow_002936 [Rhodococcus wratislaviensis]